MSADARLHLARNLPALEPVLEIVGTLPKLRPSKVPVPEALVAIVIGQMLSGQAADTIYQRVRNAANRRQLRGSWLVHGNALRAAGLSARKVRAIRGLRRAYANDPELIDNWHRLDSAQLFEAVKALWGLSDWTASMLAIFHFAHEDVYPVADGSLERAVAALQRGGIWNRSRHGIFEPLLAAPYRSYLALYLWKALDKGLLNP